MTKRILFGVAGSVLLGTNLLGLGTGTMHDGGLKRHAVAVLNSETGYLGVSIRDINPEDVAALSLRAERGAYIEGVEKAGPAEEAGLQAGDVVLEYAGNSVSSVRQFRRLVSETPPGREVRMKVWRAGTDTELSARVGKRAGNYAWFGRESEIEIEKEIVPGFGSDGHNFFFGGHDFSMAGRKPRLGIQVAQLTDQMADFLGIPGKKGVLILETLPSTPAEAAGLQAGDVILSVNGKEVSSPSELHMHLLDGENQIRFARNKQISNLKVNLDEDEAKSDDAIEM